VRRAVVGCWLGVVLALLSALSPARAQAEDGQPAASGSVPATISIPRIGTEAAVVPLGMDDEGVLDAPSDPDTVGWFMLGPGVGAPGNAILDGHVDWGGRLRVFGLLKTLRPGDDVLVTDQDGQTFRYSVAWTRLVDADAAVDDIYAQGSDQELTLITCGGAFDQSIHMYLSRWVVRAVSAD
jgi:LPXTG-site transpeptidase (sortase) family protein